MHNSRLAIAVLFCAASLGLGTGSACGQQPMSTNIIGPRQPLIEAVRTGREQQVAELLSGGADTAQRDPLGRTALHYASSLGQRATVIQLLDAGAEVDARDEAGFTPLMRAAQGGHGRVVQALLDRDADPTLRALDGRQPAELVPHGATELRRLLTGGE